ncbi:MAG: nitrous oxide reductase family maturation protein NosD [Sulfurimonas sp.]|jgi:nitrous oxidase accessory protein|nr:nitrous oxide reductase family maturation protein NosD [Sulfurimonadaceae bacterium]
MLKKLLLGLSVLSTLLNASLLQEAIDSADEGSIIRLKAGIYDGAITINKPISIIGEEDGVVIDGGGVGSVVNIRSPYVTLKNLTIRGSGDRHENIDSAVSIKEATQCEVSDCTIEDSLFGIDLEMVNNSIISNNTISSKDFDLGLRGDGIRLWYSHNNIIKANRLTKSRDMVIWYSHSNEIVENYSEFCRYSLHFMYAGRNIVKNNHYRQNSVGIFFMYSKDTEATGNIIESSLGTTGMGIGLKEVSNFTIDNNQVLYCAQGFYIDRSPFEPDTTNIINNNKILYNTEAIHFHSINENNTITNNMIAGNIEDVVNDSRGTRTYNNHFENNYWDNYEGFDTNGDNIGDTPHKVYQYADQIWAYNDDVKFFYASPIISLLNFLAKLAPFTEPVFLMEDKKPKINMKG